MLPIGTIAICGAGTMGSGIAQVSAQSGFKTILYDLSETMLSKAQSAIEKSLEILVEKAKITAAQKEETFNKIQFTNDVRFCMADLCVEAIIEKEEAKVELFSELNSINGANCILASNTSSLSITAIAKKIKRPQQMVGMHFFNPAQVMKLVEVVQLEKTRPEVVQTVLQVVMAMGKTPVVCRDFPGFIVNRVARPYYIESLRLVENGLTSYEQADKLLESIGFKMGPFKLMDLIGNDVNYAVSRSVYDQLDQPARLKPSPIQKDKVEKGELGRKTGKGYYTYKE